MTIHQAIEAKIAHYGSAKTACHYFMCSEPYLSQIRSGQRPVPERIGRMLGYRMEWIKVSDDLR